MKKFVSVFLLIAVSIMTLSCSKESNYETAIIGKWRLTMFEEYENGVITTRETADKDFYKLEYFIDGKLDREYIEEPMNVYFQFFEDGSLTAISDDITHSTFEIKGTALVISGNSFIIKKLTRKELVFEEENYGTEWWRYFERVE